MGVALDDELGTIDVHPRVLFLETYLAMVSHTRPRLGSPQNPKRLNNPGWESKGLTDVPFWFSHENPKSPK
jgi:hypothetical protein